MQSNGLSGSDLDVEIIRTYGLSHRSDGDLNSEPFQRRISKYSPPSSRYGPEQLVYLKYMLQHRQESNPGVLVVRSARPSRMSSAGLPNRQFLVTE